MSILGVDLTVWLHTNPEELREIADEMEKKIPQITCGDSVTIRTINIGDDMPIYLKINWDMVNY